MKTPEGKIKDKVKEYLKSIGAYYFMPVQMGYGAPSVDLLVCYKGFFIAIETKAPGKEPTKRQDVTMEAMCEAGAICIWGDNADEIIAIVARAQALIDDEVTGAVVAIVPMSGAINTYK